MLFIGMTFMGYDEFSVPCAPIESIEIDEIILNNGMFKRFYVTKDIDSELNESFPDDFDYNTILYAKYDNSSSNAGNIDWSLENISHLLIKRKEKGKHDWTTIAVKEITDKKQISLTGVDYTNAAKTTYEYAVLPSFYGIEGGYDSTEIYSNFNEVFVISQNGGIHTDITNGFLNTTNNSPSSNLVLLNNEYPVIIKNSIANYQTGSFTGSFFPFENCDLDMSEKAITDLQEYVISFLSDGTIKLIKCFDGRIFLVNIDPEINNNANGFYKNREITFTFTCVGNPKSTKDLYNSGLSNVSEEWW